jgi:pimeloyl-ACP methyl ester carboxylesterase
MNLFYRELANNTTTQPPIIVLHGLFGSSDNWLTISKKIAEKYHLYLLDQRNHGRSDWHEDFDYATMSADLKQFITEKNIKNPILLGHSMGGKVAMQFAFDYPNDFDKLIVVDIAPKKYPIHHDQIIRGMKAIDLLNLSGRNEAEEILAQYEPDAGTRQFLLKSLYRDDYQNFAWRVNLDVIDRKIANIVEPLDTQNRQSFKPTLFIRGEKSRYITNEDFTTIEQLFPNVEIHTVANAGHWVQAEKPNEFLEVVLNYLAKFE